MRYGEIHHLQVRKRINVEHQAYPHPDKFIRTVDKIVYALSVIFPMTLVPQVWNIFTTHNVTGISLTTWILSVVFGIPMTTYAIVHKLKPLIIMNFLWMIMYFIIIVGIVMYR